MVYMLTIGRHRKKEHKRDVQFSKKLALAYQSSQKLIFRSRKHVLRLHWFLPVKEICFCIL